MRELSGPFRFQQRIYIHLNHVANGQNVNMPVPVKTLRFFCEPLLNSLTHRFIRRFYNNLDLSTGNRLTDNLSPRSGCLLYVAIVANAYYQSQWPARRCIQKPPHPWNSRNTSMTRNIYLQFHQRQAVIKKKQFRVIVLSLFAVFGVKIARLTWWVRVLSSLTLSAYDDSTVISTPIYITGKPSGKRSESEPLAQTPLNLVKSNLNDQGRSNQEKEKKLKISTKSGQGKSTQFIRALPPTSSLTPPYTNRRPIALWEGGGMV